MLASGVVAGILLGFAFARTWRPLLVVHIRWLPLLIAGVGARAIAPLVPSAALALYVFAIAATAIGAAANVRLAGAGLVALGGALNLAVVLLNHGMPVDPAAIVVAMASMPSDALHVVITESTQLGALADVIPVAPVRAVYSIGDFCIALGGFLVPFVLLIRR
jgi:hypothetical protein